MNEAFTKSQTLDQLLWVEHRKSIFFQTFKLKLFSSFSKSGKWVTEFTIFFPDSIHSADFYQSWEKHKV